MQQQARPLWDSFHHGLLNRVSQAPLKGLLGKVISYVLNQWNRVQVYLEDGIITPDNNRAKNAIRPFVIGRKNRLFSERPKGQRPVRC